MYGQASSPAARKTMTFLDSVTTNSIGDTAFSVDGKWMLYTLSVPDWKDGRSFTDIYMVSVDRGLAATRQMTFTKNKNENSPLWSRDGKFFVFLSNREGSDTQLYMMRPDGGEARKLTEVKDGVNQPVFSRDGKWLAFLAGKDEQRQIWTIPAADIDTAEPLQLTKHLPGITSFQFSPDSRHVYYVSPATFDKDNRERIEKKFDVRVRNQEVPPNYLWSLDLATRLPKQLTSGIEYSVADVRVSDDSRWVGFRGVRQDRYVRTVTDVNSYSDLYLLNTSSGQIERLVSNTDINESSISFSPDSTLLAFTAPSDFRYSAARKIYVRKTAENGASPRKLATETEADLSIDFWSKDARTIYSNAGIRSTQQLLAISVETGRVTQVTNEKASLTVSSEEDSGVVVVAYSDPGSTRDIYVTSAIEQTASAAAWKRLTDSNPQLRNLLLGETEAIQWKSKDGTAVEGILVRPVAYERGKRYPLIVQIHGGPASADVLSFDGSASVYAGLGYAVLQPNYRGSTNYGEKFRTDIAGAGNYFPKGYEDIMSGVDHLIQIGLVDSNRMGVMGWSAGGHWSNWILTHTDRFKAISSGAGVANWLSMYAQTDTHRGRENYFGGSPYDLVDHLWDISPLKYIKNAKTPTLLHVVDGDPRVPRPQSEEMHMALKKLGVPTELFVYPGSTHGIPDMRNRLVKAVSEFRWFDKWINGKETWLDWKELLETLKIEKQ